MVLVRLKAGVTVEQVTELAESGGDPTELLEGGAAILIAGPGEATATRLFVDFVPGATYALVCNFQDAPDAPPHTALGMLSSLEVSAG